MSVMVAPASEPLSARQVLEPGGRASNMSSLKRLLVYFGSILAAAWTVGNIFALYWAKVYLFDRPALIIMANGTQVPRSDDVKQMVVTLEFENNGIWPYELLLKAKKPI